LLLDDGTGTATVEVSGDALAVLPQLRSGMAVNIVGVAWPMPIRRPSATQGHHPRRRPARLAFADGAASGVASADPAAASRP
jgi:hypothetical protein